METSNDPELPIFVTVLGKKPLTPVLNLNLNLTLNPRPRIVPGDPRAADNYRPIQQRGTVGFPLTPTAAGAAHRLRGSAEIDSCGQCGQSTSRLDSIQFSWPRCVTWGNRWLRPYWSKIKIKK